MTNKDCIFWFNQNITTLDQLGISSIRRSWPCGLTDDLMCTRGNPKVINDGNRGQRTIFSVIGSVKYMKMNTRIITVQCEFYLFQQPAQGDSGGPLYLDQNDRRSLVGLVSGGLRSGGLNYPTIYTRVR